MQLYQYSDIKIYIDIPWLASRRIVYLLMALTPVRRERLRGITEPKDLNRFVQLHNVMQSHEVLLNGKDDIFSAQ